MLAFIKFCSKKPIESLSAVIVTTLVCSYWVWLLLNTEELFKPKNSQIPSFELQYKISSDQSVPFFSLLDHTEHVPSSASNFQLRLLTLRIENSFEAVGILQPQYVETIQNITAEITEFPVLKPNSHTTFSFLDIAENNNGKPIIFCPFTNTTIDTNSALSKPFDNSYLLLDKRYSSKNSLLSARGVVIAFLLRASTSEQRHLNDIWWERITEAFQNTDSSLYNFIKHKHSSLPIADDSTDYKNLSFSFSSLINRSGFSTLAAVALNYFWNLADLIESATSSEISLVSVAYCIVLILLIHLFVSMKKFGSNISIAFSILVSQVASFIMSLAALSVFGIKVDYVALMESLPYIIIFNGFDKHLLLTKSVLLVSSHHYNKNIKSKNFERDSNFKPLNPETVSHLVVKGFKNCYPIFIREYSFTLVAFIFGFISGIPGLVQFSLFAFFVLLLDIILMITVFLPMLTLKLNLIYARSSVFKKLVLNSNSQEAINYKSLIQNASENDSNFMSKIKINIFIGYVAMIFMDFKILPSAFFSNTVSPDPLLTSIESTGSVFLDTLIKPLLFNASDVIKDYPFYLNLSTPLQYYIKPQTLTISQNILESKLSSFIKSFPTLQNNFILFAFFSSLSLNVYFFIRSRYSIPPVNQSSAKNISKISSFYSSLNLTQLTDSSTFNVSHSVTTSETNSESEEDTNIKSKICTKEHSEKNLKNIKSYSTLESPQKADISCKTMASNKTRSLLPSKQFIDNITLSNQHKKIYDRLQEHGPQALTDQELIVLVQTGLVPQYSLEARLEDHIRAVKIRRSILFDKMNKDENISFKLPYKSYDYSSVTNQCCENVIGFLPIPVGLAGPLLINDESLFIPMATTEGALIASTSRGCKAISLSGGVKSFLLNDGMTRGPCLELPDLSTAYDLKMWLDSEDGFGEIKANFESTSRFAKLLSTKATLSGRLIFIRFRTFTGDAMGMNMISKGTEKSLRLILERFPGSKVVAISGNYCTDKKPAAINWIEGRGKSIVAEAIIPPNVVQTVLKTTVSDLIDVNTKKNLVGSAMAGALGGFNAHAANILTAIFLATGQDPAQNVESSNCLTFMQEVDGNLVVNITMPSIEVGTVGGGTSLLPQQSCLSMLKCVGPSRDKPGSNAQRLAKIIAGCVMAGELSLLAALASGDLVKSHIKLNRKPQTTLKE
ncbi:hypothetical protein BB561_006585 [Smittium simulii]|uniref:3-hydroxy-3-methylglutaryl coenzyme A reductase n=1 Tax=Smittium simulii TaxID=133385 RepID=A0A2T9Y337_9FUNG|nr:hypothetical protein BB561_006585 [Smittium simulii]